MPAPVNEARRVSTAQAVFLIVMTLIGWSSVPLFLKHFADLIDKWTSNGWRYGFSALLWLPVVLLGLATGRLPRGIWKLAIIPAVFNSIGQICFTAAHYMIGPALLTFGLRLQILFVATGAFLLFPAERRVIRHPFFIIGALTVLGGTLGTVLIGDDQVRAVLMSILRGEGAGDAGAAKGVALAVASGLFFALYALSVRKYMHGIAPVTAFAVISQYTAIVMVALMLTLGDRAGLTVLDLGDNQIALLLASAVIGIALGHVFYYAAIARLGVAVSSGVVQLQPFLVAAGSAVLFSERLTQLQLASGGVAVAGAALMLTVQARLAHTDARATRRAATELLAQESQA